MILMTFLTDTREEKNKFLTDAMTLAKDITFNQTFNTVRPLINTWAAFTPSNEVNLHHLS